MWKIILVCVACLALAACATSTNPQQAKQRAETAGYDTLTVLYTVEQVKGVATAFFCGAQAGREGVSFLRDLKDLFEGEGGRGERGRYHYHPSYGQVNCDSLTPPLPDPFGGGSVYPGGQGGYGGRQVRYCEPVYREISPGYRVQTHPGGPC